MPENLRITAPVPNSDGILKPNPSAQSSQIEPMDPARVNRPNTQDQNTDSASLNLLLSRDSVFGKFIQQLRQTPALSETLGKLLLNTVRRLETSPDFLPENSALRELASSLAAEQGGLINDLMFQQKNSTLFSGPLFQLLSRISQQAEDPRLDLRIAGFLKAFDGFSSAKETTEAILSNLNAIGRRIPTNYAKQLALLSEKLNTSDPEGAVNENLNLLKKEILPFLSDYVSKSSDYGKMREILSLLLQNLSILNVSSRENLQSQFQQLAAYCGRHTAEPTLRLMRSSFLRTRLGPGPEKKNRKTDFSIRSLPCCPIAARVPPGRTRRRSATSAGPFFWTTASTCRLRICSFPRSFREDSFFRRSGLRKGTEAKRGTPAPARRRRRRGCT
ncbi:hypothetical protein [Caproicibacter fermentans]|uniref:Uncharacterized protein n=1 Tax=Caproicibacter fermentans TaxID=2576756 RepID=A0A7G8TFF9_9FIRM|nr:hypothetical protein [Caproicibacter fermentans]QNK42350.1 hypothetical protein HCR03_09150 [Caproicibacter fermentans]